MVRLTVLYWGLPGTGKSFNALTFPRPLRYHNWDLNSEHLISGGKLIHPALRKLGTDVKEYAYAPFKPLEPPDRAEALLNTFYTNLEADLKEIEEGTIVIDTLSSVMNRLNKVYLSQVEQRRGYLRDDKGNVRIGPDGKPIPNPGFEIYPFDYGERNDAYKTIVNVSKGRANVNLVLTCQAKEIYDTRGRGTGTYEPQAHEMTPYLVQINLRALIQDGIPMASVNKWSWKPERAGEVLDDPTHRGIARLVDKDVAAVNV